MEIFQFIFKILKVSFSILNSSSIWLVFSFFIAGIIREFIDPRKLQKSLGNKSLSALLKSTISGMLLPICSCGVIPLGIGMYFSGAYLGPVLAFMTATPIINPAALILAYGLLGKDIATIYLICGFLLPMIVGYGGNYLGGKEIKPPVEEVFQEDLEEEKTTLKEKITIGLKWSFLDLGLMVGKYVILGVVLGGFIFTAFPKSFIEKYLGNPQMISLFSISILASISYVCAVGHIPFIAALIAGGASPGTALTFLIGGTGTNLPELISMWKLIGKRSAILYGTIMVLFSFGAGYFTNEYLGGNFKPAISFEEITGAISSAQKFIFVAPEKIKYISSIFIVFLGLKGWYKELRRLMIK
ncbi:MAG: efflux transporter SaoE [Cetobacterium sp.]|uniref:efflux transporter SaoE n=1 Tax=Cetobacterium sp. TaxID=2071632 RepID=UPI003F39601F